MALGRRGRGDHASRRVMLAPTREPLQRVRAMVAGAQRIRLGQGSAAAARSIAKAQGWQSDAWDVFDEVPEVKHAVWYTGNAMSKLRLYAAVRPTPDADPIPVSDPDSGISPELARAAEAELERLKSAQGGQPEILRSLNMNLEVAALGYLVGYGERPPVRDERTGAEVPGVPERWEIRSVSEVDVNVEGDGPNARVKARVRDLPGAPQRELDPDLDTITPIWQRHPRWTALPDCHMRAIITDARALQMLTGQVLAEAMSAMPAQILALPLEASFSKLPDPNVVDDEGAEVDDVDGEGDEADEADEDDEFEDALDQHIAESIEDPQALSVARPLVLRLPSEFCKKDFVFTVDLARKLTPDIEARIKARVDRLARGLNLPVEVVLGHQGTTFANAEQVDEDTFEDYLEPRCELIVDALTVAFLRPNMIDADHDAEQVARIFVWYDASRLVESADTNANADAALEHFAISLAAYRKAKGFGEDDAPDPLEVLFMIGAKRGMLSPEVTVALLELLGEPITVDVPEDSSPEEQQAAEAEARNRRLLEGLAILDEAGRLGAMRHAVDTAAREAARPHPALAAGRPASTRPNVGARLREMDADLRSRIVAAADSAVVRAMERVGNQVRTRSSASGREQLRNVAPHLRAAHVGRVQTEVLVGEVGDLLEGAFAELERQFMQWGAGAQRNALDLVNDLVGGFDAGERDTLGLRQAEDLGEGWRWLDEQLRSLTEARLFSPDVNAPELGEFDPSLRVPTGMVRQALARAGGAANLTTDSRGSAFVTLVENGSRPAGGIGTGELIRGTMRDHGATIEAYRWVYGPAFRQRPFEPHEELDGIVFENFDSPALANYTGFPEFEFYLPGDHAGCVCDVEPVVVPPDDLDDQ